MVKKPIMQSIRTIAQAVLCAALALAAAPLIQAADETEVRALEAICEQAREAKLKPLRDAEIARCKAEKGNDPAYCERYWRNYGDAMRRPNGTMTPRRFDELPECVAAQDARRRMK